MTKGRLQRLGEARQAFLRLRGAPVIPALNSGSLRVKASVRGKVGVGVKMIIVQGDLREMTSSRLILAFQEVSKNPRVIHKSNLKKIHTIL
jgi:hypothetical protein